MKEFLPYGRHSITEEDLESVLSVLKGSSLTQGPKGPEFEEELIKLTGAGYASVVSSGTAALHMAVLALSLPQESRLVVPAVTFAATSNAVIYAGHTPVFCDVEADTGLMSMNHLGQILEDEKRAGRRIAAVLPVHFTGQPVDMVRLSELKRQYDFFVIEDAAHAIGASYSDGRMVGGSHLSEMTIFSFHPVKHVATGEGGAVLSMDPVIAERVAALRSHGIVRNGQFMQNKREAFGRNGLLNPWYMEMQSLGYNYRMPDILAALGVSQIKRLKRNVASRRALSAHYNERFRNSRYFRPLAADRYGQSSCHLMAIEILESRLAESRAKFMDCLRERNIGTQVHYIPVPMHPYYSERGYSVPPVAEKLYRRVLSLPLFPAMTLSDVDEVVSEMGDLVEGGIV